MAAIFLDVEFGLNRNLSDKYSERNIELMKWRAQFPFLYSVVAFAVLPGLQAGYGGYLPASISELH